MTTYYHGTVSTFVPDILKAGLVGKPEYSWQVAIAFEDGSVRSPDDSQRKGNIYLATLKRVAVWYAINKATYYRAKPHGIFDWAMMTADGKELIPDSSRAMKLNDNLYFPSAKPVVFAVTVTPRIKAQLVEDKDGVKGAGYQCLCTVPPSHLKLVWQG